MEEEGGERKVVDVSYLACDYHSYMILGVSMVASEHKPCEVLVIGLGGGGLCTYLRACFQNVSHISFSSVQSVVPRRRWGEPRGLWPPSHPKIDEKVQE